VIGNKLDQGGKEMHMTQVSVVNFKGDVARVLADVSDSLATVVFQTRPPAYSSFAMPFGFRALIATSADGAFTLVVSGTHGRNAADTIKITAIRPTGETAYSVKQILPTVRVPKEELERARETSLGMAKARRDGHESALQDTFSARMPSTYPVVTSAFIARDGRAWIRLWSADAQAKYMSISPAGKPEGVVSLPQVAALVGAAGDRLWVTEADSDGFQNIVQYRIYR
jgi:hypothetical protein